VLLETFTGDFIIRINPIQRTGLKDCYTGGMGTWRHFTPELRARMVWSFYFLATIGIMIAWWNHAIRLRGFAEMQKFLTSGQFQAELRRPSMPFWSGWCDATLLRMKQTFW
jgi:hypothetical protein